MASFPAFPSPAALWKINVRLATRLTCPFCRQTTAKAQSTPSCFSFHTRQAVLGPPLDCSTTVCNPQSAARPSSNDCIGPEEIALRRLTAQQKTKVSIYKRETQMVKTHMLDAVWWGGTPIVQNNQHQNINAQSPKVAVKRPLWGLEPTFSGRKFCQRFENQASERNGRAMSIKGLVVMELIRQQQLQQWQQY